MHVLYHMSIICTVYGRCRKAIEDTKWVNLKPLFCAKSIFIVGEEPRVADLMAIMKKTPELVILGTEFWVWCSSSSQAKHTYCKFSIKKITYTMSHIYFIYMSSLFINVDIVNTINIINSLKYLFI